MITLEVQIEMEDSAWADHVLGSGAAQYEWWHDIYQNKAGDVIIDHWYNMETELYNEDHEGAPFRYYTTLQKIADAATEYATMSQFVTNQMVNDDFDADGIDQILQFLIFESVVFG